MAKERDWIPISLKRKCKWAIIIIEQIAAVTIALKKHRLALPLPPTTQEIAQNVIIIGGRKTPSYLQSHDYCGIRYNTPMPNRGLMFQLGIINYTSIKTVRAQEQSRYMKRDQLKNLFRHNIYV